jgi:hypothetical protein
MSIYYLGSTHPYLPFSLSNYFEEEIKVTERTEN